jgi:hypothetical protein
MEGERFFSRVHYVNRSLRTFVGVTLVVDVMVEGFYTTAFDGARLARASS